MNTSVYNVEPDRSATKVESRALGLNIVKRGMGFDAGPSKTEVTFAPGGSDLQKSRHLQKSRVTERHNRGHKAKIEVAPPPQKRCETPFCAPGATSIVALCPDCDATFLQMTRLPQVTGSAY